MKRIALGYAFPTLFAITACGTDYTGGGRRTELPDTETPAEQDAATQSDGGSDDVGEPFDDVGLGDAGEGEDRDYGRM